MALHLAIDDAPHLAHSDDDSPSHTTLPKHRDDYDWGACSEFLFQDHDVMWLYDRRYRENAGAGADTESWPVPAALEPDHWFEDLNVPPRDPERGFRR